jgi:hypothetical protein
MAARSKRLRNLQQRADNLLVRLSRLTARIEAMENASTVVEAYIDADGVFHAGNVPGVYIVRATSVADPGVYDEAIVTVVGA